MSELYSLTAHQLRDMLRNKQISSVELTQSVINRMQQVEPKVQAYITQCPELALEQAKAADERLASGDEQPELCGIPVAIKDNMCTEGVRTTAASKILSNFIPPYDGTVVSKLRAQGVVFTGKTNLDEFAMGSSTENSAFFPSRNPWNTNCVPGGSSGGSAVAVSADECIVSMGSDTGGSIRQPAALCGVVGMKPTYGRVSRYGLIAFASSLDQIGPFSKDVEDCAIALNAICGKDSHDSTSVDLPKEDFGRLLHTGVKGLRVGVPKEYFGEGVDPEVGASVMAAIEELRAAGAEIVEISLPSTGYGLACYYILAPCEASSNLARFDGVKYGHRTTNITHHTGLMEQSRGEGFGAEVKQRIMIGTYALSAGYYDAYYLKAQQARTIIRQDFDTAFQSVDVIATPTSPVVAFGIGEKANDPLSMKLADICTILVNIAGLPAMSMPCGFKDGLPVGLQLIGKPYQEAELLRVAQAYELRSGLAGKKPNIG